MYYEALDKCISVIVFIWLMGVIAIEYINWQYNPTNPNSHVLFLSRQISNPIYFAELISRLISNPIYVAELVSHLIFNPIYVAELISNIISNPSCLTELISHLTTQHLNWVLHFICNELH